MRSSINSHKNIPIETIPCCIDLGQFKRKEQPDLSQELGLKDKFVVVYSGSVGTYNQLNEMFDFFKETLNMIPNAHFLILTHNRDTVLKLIGERQDIDESTVTVRYALHSELPRFLSMGDVGLVFRRVSPTAIAASPTKFGEYLACGLPVVSNPQIGDLEEIINSNKIGAILSTNKDTIEEILTLLKDQDARKRCEDVARQIYSLDKGVSTYRDIYYKLTN